MKAKDLKLLLEQVPDDYNVVTSKGVMINDEHWAREDRNLEVVHKDDDSKELCLFFKIDGMGRGGMIDISQVTYSMSLQVKDDEL